MSTFDYNYSAAGGNIRAYPYVTTYHSSCCCCSCVAYTLRLINFIDVQMFLRDKVHYVTCDDGDVRAFD